MTLAVGTRLGPYEVLAVLGAGGMGEVYRAHDGRLNRDVAVKVLPESFATDSDRLARFRREAQVLASLNHTNIAHVYGLELTPSTSPGQPDVHALVMELVEGPTLAELPAMPLAEALPVAIQIAAALESAHEHGIIHRDLKPANIKITARGAPPPRDEDRHLERRRSAADVTDGVVKVLDFGLAKALVPDGSGTGAEAMHSPTITSPALTGMGVILGTAAYMAPEQARGRAADRRADIWAFGCVLYELLTGRRAFGGDSVTDTLAFVITREPDWAALPPDTPAAIRRLLQRCLEKDWKRRLHDIGDARLDLEEALASPAPGVRTLANEPRPTRAPWLWPAAIVTACVLTGLVTWIATRQRPATAPAVQRLTIALPDTVRHTGGGLAVSPDGTRLVYAASEANGPPLLYLRTLDRLEAERIRGTEDGWLPFFSPDGEWIGFSAGGKLRKVAVRGGPSITICDAPTGAYASWGADDAIVFATGPLEGHGLFRVSAAGGAPARFTTPDASAGELSHLSPAFLPGGRAVVFSVVGLGQVTFDAAHIAVTSLDTGKHRTVIERGHQARFVSSGHLIYAAGETLMAVPFDTNALETRGPAVPVADGVAPAGGASNPFPLVAFDVSPNGLLVYAPAGSASARRTLVWVDRQGREQAIPASPHAYQFPRVSPDGTRIAVEVRDQGSDIWIWDVVRQTLTRLTLAGLNGLPTWTPDSRRLIFGSTRAGGAYNLYWQAADGSSAAERLTDHKSPQFPYRTTPNGKWLLFQDTEGSVNIHLLTLDGDRRVSPLLATSADEATAAVSPDGRWIAHASNESGQLEVYVRPFPNVGDGRRQVSTGGGSGPIWIGSGQELVYTKAVGRSVELAAVSIKDGAADGAPRVLFRGPYVDFLNLNYDAAPDGQRFVMVKSLGSPGEPAGSAFVAVLNWAEELRRLVPAKSQ